MKNADPNTMRENDYAAARRVRSLREYLGWTQEELAAKSGVGRSTIAKIDSANHKVGSVGLRATLAAGFGVSPDLFAAYLAGNASAEQLFPMMSVREKQTSETESLLRAELLRIFKLSRFGEDEFDRAREMLPDIAAMDTGNSFRNDAFAASFLSNLLTILSEQPDAKHASFVLFDMVARCWVHPMTREGLK